jgi:20S proteasome alpha/beta subunit
MDGLGAPTVSDKFAGTGTASEWSYALCESLYLPNLDSQELLVLAEKCFRLGLQRDILSGGDFQIITITRGNIFVKDIVKSDV